MLDSFWGPPHSSDTTANARRLCVYTVWVTDLRVTDPAQIDEAPKKLI